MFREEELAASGLRSHPLVKVHKVLTETSTFIPHSFESIVLIFFCSGWERIKPKLVEYLKTSLDDIAFKEHSNQLGAAIRSLKSKSAGSHPQPDAGPQIIDFYFIPEIRALVDVEPSATLDAQVLVEQLTTTFPSLVHRWKQDVETQISAIVAAEVHPPSGVNPLALVSAVFTCLNCNGARPYPAILGHPCLHMPYVRDEQSHTKTQAMANSRDRKAYRSYDTRPQAIHDCHPWSLDVLKVSADRVKNLIEACGKDPCSATCEGMDAADARFICLLCRRPGSMILMDWRTAVSIDSL